MKRMPPVNQTDVVARDKEEMSTIDTEKPGVIKAPKHVEDEEKGHSVAAAPSKSGPSKMAGTSVPPKRAGHEKHAELFRKDLISAMKLPDTELLQTEEYVLISDTWKLEWERGVQVPVEPHAIPPLVVRQVEHGGEDGVTSTPTDFTLPKKFLHLEEDDNYKVAIHELYNPCEMSESICRYDLDELDLCWLSRFNDLRLETGEDPISESEMERIMEGLETHCHVKLQQAIRTVDGLGIEYDENVVCDVCRSPEGEDSNEMVFCDACDICVHQACYGIQNIPEGNWLCRTCALNIQPKCVLCPQVGGAMKSTKSGLKWAHISCALWIPEVTIDCPDKMEPITNVSQIPASRWALICSLCREREGACIQCAVKSCKTAFHVTCAFQEKLDLKTIVDDDGLDIHMKAYCSKHSAMKDEVQKKMAGIPSEMKDLALTDEERTELRSHRLKKLDEEFYKHVNPVEVSEELQLDLDLVDCLCSYWVLKRKMRFDRPLLMPKTEEQSMLAKQRETLIARMNMFIRLRQDLERCRNLCYMVNKREKTRSLLYQLKEDLFHREAALFDAGDTISEDLQPCFAHRLTGTFYDKPDTILEAARLLEIRGEQIDRENSAAIASNNTATASISSISKILGNQDLPLFKSRRNRMTQGRVQRTDADSATSPPGSQIQQLFRDKMEGLELRGWTAASGTEVKLDSEHLSHNDTGDSVGECMKDRAGKTVCASDSDIKGQKILKPTVSFESEERLERTSLKKPSTQRFSVERSASKSKQSRLVGDVDAQSSDDRCSSDSALNALDLTPVTAEKTRQQLSPREYSNGHVKVCKRNGVQLDEGGSSTTTENDSCETKKDCNNSSTREHEHSSKADELNDDSSKIKSKDTREQTKDRSSCRMRVCKDTTERDVLDNGSITPKRNDTKEENKDCNSNRTRVRKDAAETDKLHTPTGKNTHEQKKDCNSNRARVRKDAAETDKLHTPTGKDTHEQKKDFNSNRARVRKDVAETDKLHTLTGKDKPEQKKDCNSNRARVRKDVAETDKLHPPTGKNTHEQKKDFNINCTRVCKDVAETDKLHTPTGKDTHEQKKDCNSNRTRVCKDVAETDKLHTPTGKDTHEQKKDCISNRKRVRKDVAETDKLHTPTGKDIPEQKKDFNSNRARVRKDAAETDKLHTPTGKDTHEQKKDCNSNPTRVRKDVTETDKLHTPTGKNTHEQKMGRNSNITMVCKDTTETDKVQEDSSESNCKDTGELKKDRNSNSMAENVELHNDSRKGKINKTQLLKQSKVASRSSPINVTPDIQKIIKSSTKLKCTSESLRVRTNSSTSKVKKEAVAKTSDKVGSTNKAVIDSDNSDSLALDVIDTDKNSSCVTISRDELESTPKRADRVSGSNESVSITLAETPKGKTLVLQKSLILKESDGDQKLSSVNNIGDLKSRPPGARDETSAAFISTLSEEKLEDKEIVEGIFGSSTNIISEKSYKNASNSFEVSSSSGAMKLDVAIERNQRLSRSLKRRSVATRGVSSDEYSTDSSQTTDTVMFDEKSRCLLECISVSNEENLKNLELEKSECVSSTTIVSEKGSTSSSILFEIAASIATKLDTSVDRKQRLSRSLKRKSSATDRASSNESQTADIITSDEKCQILLESPETVRTKVDDKVTMVTEVVSSNELASVAQRNCSADSKISDDKMTTVTTVYDNDENNAVVQADLKKSVPKELGESNYVCVVEEVCEDIEKESSARLETFMTGIIDSDKPNIGETLNSDADVNRSVGSVAGRIRRLSRKLTVGNVTRTSAELVSGTDNEKEFVERIPEKTEYSDLDETAGQSGAVTNCDKTMSTDLKEMRYIEINHQDFTETAEHQVLKSNEDDGVANGVESSYLFNTKTKQSNNEEEMLVHNIDPGLNKNYVQPSGSYSSVEDSCVQSQVSDKGNDKSSDIRLHEDLSSIISPVEDINSDSCEQFRLEIETQVAEAGDVQQTSVVAVSAHLDEVKVEQVECQTFVATELSSSKISSTGSRRRLGDLTDRGENRKIGAKRRRSTREDNTKIATGTFQFAATDKPKSEVDVGLCDLSNVLKDQSFCYNVKAEYGFKADDFDTKTVETSAILLDSRLVTDSKLQKFDDDSLDASYSQKEDIVGRDNVGLGAVDQWLSVTSGISISRDLSPWTRHLEESVSPFNDGISSRARNPANMVCEQLSSYFNRSISEPFNSSLAVDPKAIFSKSPVVKVASKSRRDQIRADLMRQFMPSQLVVADSIKQRVIEGLGQIALAARQSRPVFCCHSRQKLITRPKFRKQEFHTRRSSSVSSTSCRRSPVSNSCGSPASRRQLPERHRRKTYLQLDYISGDELTSPLKDGCSSSDSDTVNLENDSDFRFSDDDDDDEFVPNARTSIKRRRRRSTVVR